MRMPSGYGSVVKLSGKRRRPFAVRTSTIQKFINVYVGQEPADTILKALRKAKYTYKRKTGYWTTLATDEAESVADSLSENGVTVKIEYRQSYIFHEYFEKRDEAYRYLAELNTGNVIRDNKPVSKSPTFKEVYDMWVEHKKSLKTQLSKSTWKSYKTGFNHLKTIHNKKIDDITAPDIQYILNQFNSLSKSLVNAVKKVLSQVEEYAIMKRYIVNGWMKYLIFEYTDSNTQIHKPFTENEIITLWQHIDNPYAVFALITIYTGLRPSELLNIKTKDVFVEQRYMVGGLKTEAGINRTIPICDRIYDLIKSLYDIENMYLFNPQYSYRTFFNYYTDTMNQLKMSHIPHDGRHTFASLMDKYGANQICTKLIMGHSMKKNITEGVYTHKELSDLLFAVNLIQV